MKTVVFFGVVFGPLIVAMIAYRLFWPVRNNPIDVADVDYSPELGVIEQGRFSDRLH